MSDKTFDHPLFYEWFEDSLVTDDNGNPLVVYHGTNQNIKEFRADRLGKNTNSLSAPHGFFFTESAIEAEEYAHMSARKQVSNSIEQELESERLLKAIDAAYAKRDFDLAERLTIELEDNESEAISGEERGANIIPVYLAIKNCFIVDAKDYTDELFVIADHVKQAKENGYDGVKMLNVCDPVDIRSKLYTTTQWVVFKPEQIISAICASQDLERLHEQGLIDKRVKRQSQAY